jgi:hypothetical protein
MTRKRLSNAGINPNRSSSLLPTPCSSNSSEGSLQAYCSEEARLGGLPAPGQQDVWQVFYFPAVVAQQIANKYSICQGSISANLQGIAKISCSRVATAIKNHWIYYYPVILFISTEKTFE